MIKKRITLVFTLIFGCLTILGQLKAYPDTSKKNIENTKEIVSVPEINAEYPGGFIKLKQYLNENVTNKISVSKTEAEIFRSPVVQWQIDENGKVVNALIFKSSNVSKIDQLLLTAVKNMPIWKPAENMGKKVNQDFKIPLIICFK